MDQGQTSTKRAFKEGEKPESQMIQNSKMKQTVDPIYGQDILVSVTFTCL